MKALSITAGAAAMLAFTALAPAAMADGPRAASGNNWSGMTGQTPVLATAPAAPAEGPRAASGNNWQGMAAPAAQAVPQEASAQAPHYQWVEGYDHGGKWRAKWTLVR